MYNKISIVLEGVLTLKVLQIVKYSLTAETGTRKYFG